jgi:hypothetical protein
MTEVKNKEKKLGYFNRYMATGDLNPCTMGLPAGLELQC